MGATDGTPWEGEVLYHYIVVFVARKSPFEGSFTGIVICAVVYATGKRPFAIRAHVQCILKNLGYELRPGTFQADDRVDFLGQDGIFRCLFFLW